jgi:hypothetical protein
VLDAVGEVAGAVEINLKPQETPWQTPLDEDTEHTTYEPSQISLYFQAATRVALVLTEFRASFRGRSTQVNAWWGAFDLAVSLYSGRAAHPAPGGFPEADLSPGRWDATLGEFVLDWDDVVAAADPHAVALKFCLAAARHACVVCGWDPGLAGSLTGNPPPVH